MPENVALKPGPLTEEEIAAMKAHAEAVALHNTYLNYRVSQRKF